ncbi:FtsX-like permease family protein [Anoxynatronum buryatiense]|uniref:ABC transport system permease protein n=1 Tax=Anoxynatronum buryatiense TaxID=489973 RepID=A0AA45WVP5_9CLOT|nr:ABC transporter permease [Anoxynatronum buryatiense]SMP54839.1 putative ABC transport system permease protein [Anoxynatronum buryatiense]
MGIILKYILKNIAEKKFRTFLIVISVTCSAALFFASSAIAGTMTVMYGNQMRMQTGEAALLIYTNEQSPSSFFRIAPDRVEGVALTAGEISMGGIYTVPRNGGEGAAAETTQLYLRGFQLEELEVMNPVIFREKAVGRPFAGNHVILSQLFADQHGFQTGDQIQLEISGAQRRLTVWGIARPTGLFRDSPQSETRTAVIPLDYAASLTGTRGSVSTAYVVLEDGADITTVQEMLQSHYPRHDVRPPFSEADLSGMLEMIVVPFFLMTAMVLFISVFIIYSTFKVITVERLPVIGTFRSIGATRKTTDGVLLGESLAYGVLGGILGNLAGIGILYAMTAILANDPWSGSMDVAMQFGPEHLVRAFFLAVGVAVVSSWIPIARVSKIPIKELVLNLVDSHRSPRRWKSLAAVLLLAAGVALPRLAPYAMAMPASLLGLAATNTGVVMAVPLLTRIFLLVFGPLYGLLFGNEGLLAVKNLRDNKNILNNITLLTIGITVLLMINTISYSVGVEVLNAYKDWQFDIMVSINGADRSTEQALRAVPGVAATYAAREEWGEVRVTSHDYPMRYLQGIDPVNYRDYIAFRPLDGADGDELMARLSEGRYIIPAGMMQKALELQVGDMLTLEMPTGPRQYEVIGFYDSLMMNGSNAIIHQQYFRSDMNRSYVDTYFVRVDEGADDAAVLAAINSKFRRRGVWGQTNRMMEEMNTESNNQFFVILKGFSLLAMAIGVFGVFNNYVISFMERRRSLAIMKSVGMSRRQVIKMIFAEAITGGCIAGVTGVVGSILMLLGIPAFMDAAGIPIGVHFVGTFFLAAIIGGILIAVLASISPALKNARMNIVEAIKYE